MISGSYDKRDVGNYISYFAGDIAAMTTFDLSDPVVAFALWLLCHDFKFCQFFRTFVIRVGFWNTLDIDSDSMRSFLEMHRRMMMLAVVGIIT